MSSRISKKSHTHCLTDAISRIPTQGLTEAFLKNQALLDRRCHQEFPHILWQTQYSRTLTQWLTDAILYNSHTHVWQTPYSRIPTDMLDRFCLLESPHILDRTHTPEFPHTCLTGSVSRIPTHVWQTPSSRIPTEYTRQLLPSRIPTYGLTDVQFWDSVPVWWISMGAW
jgi:hypothetical protein